jgi:DNA-binding transcriptional MerR regulator
MPEPRSQRDRAHQEARPPSGRASANDTAGFVDAHRDATTADQVFGISELADALGTTTRAIRFYEEKGLLTPQRVGQNRVYTRRERARLQLILRGKSLGLTLRELQEYLDLYGEAGRRPAQAAGAGHRPVGADDRGAHRAPRGAGPHSRRDRADSPGEP